VRFVRILTQECNDAGKYSNRGVFEVVMSDILVCSHLAHHDAAPQEFHEGNDREHHMPADPRQKKPVLLLDIDRYRSIE
jgi:hypothetical protein